MSWITLGQHRRSLEGSVSEFAYTQSLTVDLVHTDDRSIRRQEEVDAGVRHQIDLKLTDIDVERSLKS